MYKLERLLQNRGEERRRRQGLRKKRRKGGRQLQLRKQAKQKRLLKKPQLPKELRKHRPPEKRKKREKQQWNKENVIATIASGALPLAMTEPRFPQEAPPDIRDD